MQHVAVLCVTGTQPYATCILDSLLAVRMTYTAPSSSPKGDQGNMSHIVTLARTSSSSQKDGIAC